MQPIDADPRDMAQVLGILAKYVANREVWAFGSRASGTAKKFSDLDLAILGGSPLPDAVLNNLAEDFRESNLPFKVDVVDWSTTGEPFRKIIEEKHVVLQQASPE